MSSGKSGEQPQAFVRVVDGKRVMIDPVALVFGRAVDKLNCRDTLEMNADRVEHFKRRASEREEGADEVVIMLINVDDVHGSVLADALMPGVDWQEIRDRGEVPYARGLAGRDGIQEFIEAIDEEAADKLRATMELAVVVVDHGVAEVYPA